MRILIVEQNGTMAAAMRSILHHLGLVQVHECGDGNQAIEMLKQHPYDLVLTDWLLPTVSGITVVQWMRANPGYERVPVIMVTMKDQPEDLLEAVEAGVNEYVLKPLDRDVVQRKVVKVLSKHEG